MASPDPWTITPAQLGRYLPMFNELRPVNGQVAADRARPFLLQSKLSMQVLGHIWNLADLDRDGKLTAQEFSIAMCLVEAQLRGIPPPPTLPPSLAASSAAANAHGGGPLSAASLMGASAGGLPAPMMPMSSTPLIPTPSGGATPLAPSPLTGLAPMMPTPVSGAPISAPVSAVGPSVPAAPALSASSSLAAAPGADDWGIPDSDRNRARLRFNELDPKRTGFLTSVIARDELTKSHLHYSILGQIWALSDLDADGKLTSDEFVIASYLVNLARAGHQLPPTLPVSLIPPSFRKRLVASGVLPPTAAGLPASSAPLGAASAAATPTPAGAPADASLVSGAGAGAGAGAAPVPVLTSSVLDNAEDRRRENFLKGQEELERRRREAEEAERKQREAADARRKAEDDARRERIEKQRQEEERLVTLAREKEAARQAELEREREALKRKEQEKMAAEAFFAWRSARLAFLTQMKNSEQESLAALQARSESLDSSLASVKSRLETATRRFAQCKEELQTERIDLEAVEESAQEKRLEAARNQQMLYDIERQTLMQRENKKAASLMISGGAGSPSISAAASAAQVQQLTEQLSLLKPQLVTLQNDLTALKPKVTQRKADLSSLTTDLTVIQDMRAQQQQRQTVLKTRKADLDKNDSQRQEYNRRKKIEGERQAAAHRRQEEAKKKQQQDQLQREKEAKEREARERETKEREAKEKEAAKQKAAAAAAAATAATAAAAAAAAASAVSATSAKPARPAPPGSKSPAAASDKPLKLAPKPPGVAANAAPARKLDVFIAQFPYTAGNDDELSFNPDDVILLVNKQDDDWWEGELNGKVGLFPSNYVRIAEPHEIPASIKSGSSAADDKKRKQEEELLRNAADLAKLEEEKRKKKAADDERARKEAEEAARKKKQEEEEAARKKKQQEAEEAAARKKKEEAEEAARKKKQAQEAEAAAAAAAATAAAAAAAAAAAKPAGEQVKALYDYKDEQSSLVFKEGDILLVSAKHDDGWWSGSLNGVEGMFPASYVEPHVAAPAASAAGDQYVAIHAFPRERDDDLALNVGDVVSVIDKSGEWWQGTLRGQTGWFPGNHVEKHTPAAAAAAPPAVPGGKTKAAAAIATAVTPSSSTSSDATSGSGKPLIGKVIAAHTPSSDSEIALTVGSLVQIIQRLPDGWWEGTVAAKGQKAQTGWFPGDCVQLMEKKGEKAGSSNSSTVGAPARPPAAAASTLPRTNSESSFVSEAPPQVPTKGASAAAGADASGATPAKVIVAYHAQNDGELSLTAGQLIKITQVTDDEMWHGTVISKNQKVSGYFPRKCVQVMVKGARPVSMMPQDEERAVAKFSYVAQNADELTLKENDVVIVKSKKEDGWWEGELNGRVGLFPANYVVSTEVNRKNLVFEELDWTETVDPDLVADLSPSEIKRQKLLYELSVTEEAYVQDLQLVVKLYEEPIKAKNLLTPDEFETLFINWDTLLSLNEALSVALKSNRTANDGFSRGASKILLESIKSMTTPYMKFCSRQSRGMALLQNKETPQFTQFLKKTLKDPRSGSLPLISFLLKPMQRISKYPLLFKGILQHTPQGHEEYAALNAALEESNKMLGIVNEHIRLIESEDRLKRIQDTLVVDGLTEKLELASDTHSLGPRMFIYEGVLIKHKNGKELYVFLFNDLIVMSRRRPNPVLEGKVPTDQAFTYQLYRKPINLSSVAVKSMPDDPRGSFLFSITHAEGTMLLRAETAKSKTLWMEKIENAVKYYLEVERNRLESFHSRAKVSTKVGELNLTIIQGINLMGMDANGLSDPFCVIKISGQEQRTRVLKMTLNPKWDSTHTFDIASLDDKLRIEVYDQDEYSTDDSIGDMELNLKDFVNTDHRTKLRRPLRHVQRGELMLQIELRLSGAH